MFITKPLVLTVFESGLKIVTAFFYFNIISYCLHAFHKRYMEDAFLGGYWGLHSSRSCWVTTGTSCWTQTISSHSLDRTWYLSLLWRIRVKKTASNFSIVFQTAERYLKSFWPWNTFYLCWSNLISDWNATPRYLVFFVHPRHEVPSL